MNIRICGSSPLSGSRNSFRWIKISSGAIRLSKTWKLIGAIEIISCDDLWTWKKPGYVTMTQRQRNNQWSGGKMHTLPPKFSECKIPRKTFRLHCLWSRRHTPHWLYFKGPNYQRWVLLIPACEIDEYFERKTSSEILERNFVLARQCPGSWNNSKTEETGSPGIQLHDLPPCSPYLGSSSYQLLTGLKRLKIAIFRPTRTSLFPGFLVERTKFWIFLSGLEKVEQRAKKCIELRGENVE